MYNQIEYIEACRRFSAHKPQSIIAEIDLKARKNGPQRAVGSL